MGAMALWRAASRGATVVGFEQYGIAHANGSSHGGSRIFRQTVFEGMEYVRLVSRARTLWAELERQSGEVLFQPSGGLCIGPPEGELIPSALQAARAGGFEYQLLDPDELATRYPQHAVVPGDVALFEPGAGVLNPEACIRAAIRLATDRGAATLLQTKVLAIQHDELHVYIEAGGRRFQARRAIITTGAWFTELLPDLRLPVKIQRSPLVWFAGPDRQAYGPERFPSFVRKGVDLDGWGIPDVDGMGVKIGAGPSASKPWLQCADDNTHPIDARDTLPAEEFCRRALPGLHHIPVKATPCMNSRTPDRDFVLGVPEAAPSLVLAGGFSGHGFKHATAVGDVAVELALDGGSDIPLTRFCPDRFSTQDRA